MGELKHFNLKLFLDKYKIDTLIETGTYKGDAVAHALQFEFKKIYTIELIEEFFNESVNRFKNNNKITLINNNSKEGLVEIFSKYNVGNCLFWLDAHLPNLYQNKYSGDYKNKKELLIPLEEELKVIIQNKDVSNDVFIMDDLRMCERGNYRAGNWEGVINAGVGGINFIFNILGNTHNIERIYDDHGYVLCTPK